MSPRTFSWCAISLFCLPLVLLLALQYRSLTKGYQENRRATLANLNRYVDILVKKTALTYTTWAEPVLAANVLEKEAMSQHLASFQASELAFARYFFFLVFTEDKYRFSIYDLRRSTWVESPLSHELRSVSIAAGHWHLRNKKGFPPPNGIQTNHDLANHPGMMRLVIDGEGKAQGLTGLILDPDYFVTQFLQVAIPNTLFIDNAKDFNQPNVQAQVVDGEGKMRFSTQAEETLSGATANGYFHLIFTDWMIRIYASDNLASQAKQAFWTGIALAIFLSLLPIIGVVFTLRAMLKYRQLSAMKSDFVSNVSHELRTPMASIHLLGEMMRSGKVTSMEKVREYGGLIELESDRLGSLIENILDFTKIESGQAPLQKNPFNLIETVEEVVASFRIRPDLCETSFELGNCPAKLDIVGDDLAIKQALFNLLDNAVKYGPPAQTVSLEFLENGEVVHIFVRDQGPGISDADAALIFERFHRTSQGDVQTVRGSGLGLTIARHIARGHGGDISVARNSDGGSCFDFSIGRGR